MTPFHIRQEDIDRLNSFRKAPIPNYTWDDAKHDIEISVLPCFLPYASQDKDNYRDCLLVVAGMLTPKLRIERMLVWRTVAHIKFFNQSIWRKFILSGQSKKLRRLFDRKELKDIPKDGWLFRFKAPKGTQKRDYQPSEEALERRRQSRQRNKDKQKKSRKRILPKIFGDGERGNFGHH